ncbi:melanoma-associated antigen 8-like [Carlito syrichta]|uniref:Melanoma-associated antigen 8-like n=1 Tax=Carlito syrichta TaxID=1868482 RepID=A0A3Q0DVE6_CARSF|nr:melanoma-associated antigen 8-like [Carlito syrichta]
MSRGERSQHCELEEDLQAQGEAPGPVAVQAPAAEVEEAATASLSASPALIPGTMEEVLAAGSPDPPQNPQKVLSFLTTIASILCSQSDEGSSSEEEEEPDPADPEFLLQEALDKKMVHLVYFLLHKYRNKEPLTKAEMLSAVIKNDEEHFSAIFSEASECMQLVFGIDVKEEDPTEHSYVFVSSLDLSYNGVLDDHSKPTAGLLITVLGMIFMEGNCVPEETIWEALRVLGVCPGREHCLYGEPRKLLTQDWVQEEYLEYRQVPGSDPACYEFLWGPRAHAETSKMKVLEHVAKVSGRDATCYPSLYEEALREKRERESEQELHPELVAGSGPRSAASSAPYDKSPILHSVFEESSQHSE